MKHLSAIVFMLLFIACTDSNPTNFFDANSSSETPLSSSVSVESSSSLDIFSSSVEKSSSSWAIYSYGELIDNRDGHVYKTIKIGNQTWMAQNLNFAYHNSAAPTPDLASPSLCYNNNPDSCAKYGRLYSWSIAMDSAMVYSRTGNGCGVWKNQKENLCKNDVYNYIRGACPENWHIPSESDIKNIVDYANESEENHTWIKHYWLYGGDDDFSLGQLSQQGYFWSSLEIDSSTAILLNAVGVKIILGDEQKQNARFIRCVKDDVPPVKIEHGSMTDERDGQVYKTVKIGNQTWMAENLNYAYLKPFDDQDSSSWCNNNDPENCTKYGRLYTWAAAVDSVNWNDEEDVLCGMKYTDVWLNPVNQGDFNIRGACPENWHVPSLNEWETMLDIINNSATDLKFSSGWSNDGNGTDIYGYGVLPVGYYLIGSEWVQEGNESCIWTAFGTTRNALTFSNIIQPCDRAYAMNFISNNKSVFLEDYIKKKYACSVRCVKGPSFFD